MPQPCTSCEACAPLRAEIAALQAETARLRAQLNFQQPERPQLVPPLSPVDARVASAFSREEMQRYGRQMLVKEFGAEAQRRLRAARVLVVGAGGLGSPVALYLAAMGVGRLSVVDDDRVDRSNLHRQVLHDEAQLGELKAESARRRLRLINPLVECEAVAERFTASNAIELVRRHDVVVDASDNVGTRYLANDACAVARKPLVSGSAIGLEGQVTVFTPESASGCYRCLYPTPPRAQPMSCAENGVIGAVPGVIGCLQAVECVKVITGVGEPLVGVQCLYDAYDGQFRRLKLPGQRRNDCPVCSAASLVGGDDTEAEVLQSLAISSQLSLEGGCSDFDMEAAMLSSRLHSSKQISVEEFAQTRAQSANYVLVDTRALSQFNMVHFKEAVHVPFELFSCHKPGSDSLKKILGRSYLKRLQQSEPPTIYVICRRGIDSVIATEWLAQSGVQCAVNVNGGYTAYASRVDSTFPIY